MTGLNFHSNGKLLLTGEYVVLDGALALAVPTKFGQSLVVKKSKNNHLLWKSVDDRNILWFEGEFKIERKRVSALSYNNTQIAERLIQILETVKQLNPDFLVSNTNLEATTQLEFPRNWGLGTSSTLINNIANWAKIDAYDLLKHTFGGSGYDIACAQHHVPITYQLINKTPVVNEVEFNPSFKTQLYFIYLNKKQNSREGIKHYNSNKENTMATLLEITDITAKIIACNSLTEFAFLVEQHEEIIAKITKQTPVKARYFNDFKGTIKSLGAWGGDFVLAVSEENPMAYFQSKGYDAVIPYEKMVL